MEAAIATRRPSSLPLPAGHRFFQDCLRENWARFIQWSMSTNGHSAWFVTQTFKTYENPGSADRKFRIWAARLKEALNDSGGAELRWIRASEWQIRSVIHYHSIVQGRGMDLLSRKRWESRWESLASNTGFCRIHEAQKKLAPYLSKYASKDLGGELDRGGDWRGLTTPTSVSCGHTQRQPFGCVPGFLIPHDLTGPANPS
jgi:hypothetical protein